GEEVCVGGGLGPVPSRGDPPRPRAAARGFDHARDHTSSGVTPRPFQVAVASSKHSHANVLDVADARAYKGAAFGCPCWAPRGKPVKIRRGPATVIGQP